MQISDDLNVRLRQLRSADSAERRATVASPPVASVQEKPVEII